MPKRLSDFLSNFPNGIFLYGLLFLVFLGVVFYTLLGRSARDAFVEQMLHREQADARTGAASIAGLFDAIGNAAVVMSSRDEIVNPGPKTDALLNHFLETWKDTPVVGAVLIDKEGKVIKGVSSDIPFGLLGQLVPDREYFTWAKTAKNDEYYVSNAILSRLRDNPYYVVPIASPVYDENGNFNGVFSVAISIDRLAKQYMEHLKVSDKGEIYLIRNDGTFIYAPFNELLGESIYGFIEKHPFLGSDLLIERLKDRLENTQEGKLEIAYPKEVATALPLESRLLAYSPVLLKDRKWILVISTPTQDALISMTPLYFRQAASVFLVFLAFLGFSIRIAKEYGYKQAEMGYPNKKETKR